MTAVNRQQLSEISSEKFVFIVTEGSVCSMSEYTSNSKYTFDGSDSDQELLTNPKHQSAQSASSTPKTSTKETKTATMKELEEQLEHVTNEKAKFQALYEDGLKQIKY